MANEKTKTILDMNVFAEVIENDFDAFDIEEAVEYMQKLDHRWAHYLDENGNPTIPTVSDVRRHLRKRIIEGYEYLVKNNADFYASSTGGYRVESRHSKEDGYWTVIMYCPVESIW